MRTRPLKVALLGCGVVGSEVARIMTTHADDLAARIGAPVELAGVAVRRPSKVREGIDPALVTTDATALVKRGDIDVVVEVIGGIEPARSLITTAIEHGASVVSANKALLAQDMFLAGTIVLLLGAMTVVGTFISDLLLMWVDPRVRAEG